HLFYIPALLSARSVIGATTRYSSTRRSSDLHLLWTGELPDEQELAEAVRHERAHRELHPAVKAAIDSLPVDCHPMDTVRTVSIGDRKSTRLNSSRGSISSCVFVLKQDRRE